MAAKLDPRAGDRVGVLVGSVAQGLELTKYLPGWPVVVAKDFVTAGLSQSLLDKLLEVPGNGDSVCSAIVTPGALAAAGQFRCLVRADAGSGGLPSAGEQQVALGDLPSRRAPRHCVLPYQSPTRYPWVQGTPRGSEFHYQQRRKRRREQLRKEDGGVLTIQQIADRDHLVDCFRQLQREGGPAPGLDGISPVDLSLREFGYIAEHLSETLIAGRYRPQPTRHVAIDKPGTDEKRVLKIGVLLDRIVGKALHETLQPYWETVYLPRSYGFRPGRSAWQMLAAMQYTMEAPASTGPR